MSGRRINDHSSWVGKAPADKPFPDGPHKVKMESSAEGSGAVAKYEDTTEAIKFSQMAGNAKIRSLPMKPGFRN